MAEPSDTTNLNGGGEVDQLNQKQIIDPGITLVHQETKPADVLDNGQGVNDLTRVNSAMKWNYEYSVQQIPPYAFGCAFFFNRLENDEQEAIQQQQFEKPDWSGKHMQFEIIEDITGVKRTIEILSNCSISEIGITKQGWLELKPDLTRLGASTNLYSINYSKDIIPGLMHIRLTGLDIRNHEKVRCETWTNAVGEELIAASFTTDAIPLLSRNNVIRIDRLNAPEGEVRELEDHIQTLLTELFYPPSTLTFELSCDYEYQITPDLPKIILPVILIPPITIDCPDQTSNEISNQLKRWYSDTRPLKGTFNFDLAVYAKTSDSQRLPVLNLTNLQLPVNSITTLSSGE